MKIKFLPLLILIIVLSRTAFGQISSVSLGGTLHLGSIQGNSPSVTSAGGSMFIDFFPWFEHDVSFRVGFSYSQKVEYFLPEDRTGRYYPLIKLFSLKGFIRQDLSYPIYIEEGAGFVYLNDRTLANINQWELGAAFSALVGLDFRKEGFSGISIGLGLDYGTCVTGTNANYTIIYFQTQYYF